MGCQLGDIIPRKEIETNFLSGKRIAFDSLNVIYQFLSSIRQPTGEPLMDSKGRTTSHFAGLFYRTLNLLEAGVRPVFVFDGEPPKLKQKTQEERRKIRAEAKEKWEKALKDEDLEAARKYAQASSKLTKEMVTESKELLDLMGLPVVQAPSEGEAQCAFMAMRGDVWAASSQDYDAVLFGVPRLIRNLAVTKKRKLPGRDIYVESKPELVELSEVLKENQLTREQLVDLAILVGTDFNEGVERVGPKTALKLIKDYGSLEKAAKEKGYDFEVDVTEVKRIFLSPDTTTDYKMSWKAPEEEGLMKFLVGEHEFSKNRIENGVAKLKAAYDQSKSTQQTLGGWSKN